VLSQLLLFGLCYPSSYSLGCVIPNLTLLFCVIPARTILLCVIPALTLWVVLSKLLLLGLCYPRSNSLFCVIPARTLLFCVIPALTLLLYIIPVGVWVGGTVGVCMRACVCFGTCIWYRAAIRWVAEIYIQKTISKATYCLFVCRNPKSVQSTPLILSYLLPIFCPVIVTQVPPFIGPLVGNTYNIEQ
jgi:hypothetical protein